MAIFNLFGLKSKKEEVSTEPTGAPVEENIESCDSSAEGKTMESKQEVITIKWGMGMPIDIIFNFIHKNFEEEGFQDALVNCDITYRDTKEKIIRNDLETFMAGRKETRCSSLISRNWEESSSCGMLSHSWQVDYSSTSYLLIGQKQCSHHLYTAL